MPLHDWSETRGWEGVHLLWIAELLRWIKPRLPAEYRAYVGSWPVIGVGSGSDSRPDLGVFDRPGKTPGHPPTIVEERETTEPDVQIALATIEPATTLFIERAGFLVAAVELISPRNKDRPSSRSLYLSRYAGYLLGSINLLLVDVHRRPAAFSFADGIAEELGFAQAPCPAPLAVAYRVGDPAPTGGRFLAIWKRPLAVGSPLPTLPLPLTVDLAVPVDLEQTYARAAADAYLA